MEHRKKLQNVAFNSQCDVEERMKMFDHRMDVRSAADAGMGGLLQKGARGHVGDQIKNLR